MANSRNFSSNNWKS